MSGHPEVDTMLLLLQLFPLASMALGACFFCGSSGRVSSVQSLASQCWEAVSAALGLLAEVGEEVAE